MKFLNKPVTELVVKDVFKICFVIYLARTVDHGVSRVFYTNNWFPYNKLNERRQKR